MEVASYYQEAGYKVLNRTDDASIEALIARMKAEGREKEIQKELKKLKNLKQTNIPKALAYVSGELFEQYIHDMKIVQHFAMLNRPAERSCVRQRGRATAHPHQYAGREPALRGQG